jgi:hypothetical protein
MSQDVLQDKRLFTAKLLRTQRKTKNLEKDKRQTLISRIPLDKRRRGQENTEITEKSRK